MSKYFDNNSAFLEPIVTQYGFNMVMTNVTKSKKKKYVNIDTRFVNEYNKSNFNHIENYVVKLPGTLREVLSVKVSQIEIPMTFFNISSSLDNNYCSLKNVTLNSTKIITINDGNYLYSTVNFNNLGDDITYSLDLSNNYVTFKNTSSTSTYLFDFTTDPSGNYCKTNYKSKLGWLLGFRNETYTLGPGRTIISESMMNIHTVRYLYLILDEFTNSFPNSFLSVLEDSFLNKKILARIAINTTVYPFGSVLVGNQNNAVMLSDTRNFQGKVDLHRINVSLVTEWGTSVNLNGNDFSFLLEIEHE